MHFTLLAGLLWISAVAAARYIVTLKSGVDPDAFQVRYKQYAPTLVHRGVVALDLDASALKFIQNDASVAHIEKDKIFQLSQSENPTVEAKNSVQGDGDIDVYVIDSGIRITHHEFEGRAVNGVNFAEDDTMEDVLGHGTAIASTLFN